MPSMRKRQAFFSIIMSQVPARILYLVESIKDTDVKGQQIIRYVWAAIKARSEEDPFSNTQLCPKHHPAYQDGAVGQEGSASLGKPPQATVEEMASSGGTEEMCPTSSI